MKNILYFFVLLLFLNHSTTTNNNVKNISNEEKKILKISQTKKNDIKNNDKDKISDIIFNHVSDSHQWEFIENKIFIPLPVIIYNKKGKIEIFSSSNFSNGKIVKGNYGNYFISKNVIYSIDKKHYRKEKILDFSITKNVLSEIISFIILFVVLKKMKNSYNKNGKNKWKFGTLLEIIILFIKNEVAIPYLGKDKYIKYFPFLLTSFFFILCNNLLGLLPGFPNVTGNINTTLVLSLFTLFIAIKNSSKHYWKHMLWMPGPPIGIKILLAPIEFFSFFIRPLTLCIRLFTNIIAGHILILSFICLIFIFKNIFVTGFSVIFCFFISLLEIMVSFLQSFIFITLSSLLIGMTTNKKKNKELKIKNI